MGLIGVAEVENSIWTIRKAGPFRAITCSRNVRISHGAMYLLLPSETQQGQKCVASERKTELFMRAHCNGCGVETKSQIVDD